MSFLTFDVETTIKQSFKRKANAFDPDNRVVWLGYKAAGKEPQYQKYRDKEHSKGWFRDMLAANPKVKILVSFNGKFDVLHAIAQDAENYEAWMAFVAGGGQMWDVQLAEYLLLGMEPASHMLSLDETAPRYGGVVKPDAVKEMWAAGIDTPDIPDDLMMNYLPGDIANTEKSFLGQIVKAQKVGQQRSIMLNMGALVYTIEAEKNGMCVDLALGHELAAVLEDELTRLVEALSGHLPADLPFDFNWGSRQQLSALIFGGSVNYKARVVITDEQGNPVYPQTTETHYLLAAGGTISQDWYNQHLMDPASDGPLPALAYFTSGKNAGEPKTKQVKVNDLEKGPKSRLEDFSYTFPGVTKPSDSWKTATEGVWQTNAAVIEALGVRDIPFLKDLARRSAVDKDLGTYFIKTDAKSGEQTGMLTLVQADGLIHHMINMTSTITGRFSSSNPNMQNIPKGSKSEVKRVFISRFTVVDEFGQVQTQGAMIQSDFTSLEIYVQAIITKCKQLIKDLIDGLDMHVARVAQSEKIEYAEALRLCKSTIMVGEDEVDQFPDWVTKRTKAKVFSFQRAYGAGAEKIALTTGMTRDEVDKLILAEMERYPEIEPFYAELGEKIKATRTGVRKVIPHPDFPSKMVTLGIGYYRTPDGKLYSYLEGTTPKFVVERTGEFAGFSPTEIKNYIVQGTGAEWAKAACWIMVREFYARRNWNQRGLIVNQVHDACYADSHPDVKHEVAAVVHASMVAASEFMEAYFNWEVPVPVPSETTWGANMMEEAKVPNIAETHKPVLNDIRNKYINQYKVAA